MKMKKLLLLLLTLGVTRGLLADEGITLLDFVDKSVNAVEYAANKLESKDNVIKTTKNFKFVFQRLDSALKNESDMHSLGLYVRDEGVDQSLAHLLTDIHLSSAAMKRYAHHILSVVSEHLSTVDFGKELENLNINDKDELKEFKLYKDTILYTKYFSEIVVNFSDEDFNNLANRTYLQQVQDYAIDGGMLAWNYKGTIAIGAGVALGAYGYKTGYFDGLMGQGNESKEKPGDSNGTSITRASDFDYIPSDNEDSSDIDSDDEVDADAANAVSQAEADFIMIKRAHLEACGACKKNIDSRSKEFTKLYANSKKFHKSVEHLLVARNALDSDPDNDDLKRNIEELEKKVDNLAEKNNLDSEFQDAVFEYKRLKLNEIDFDRLLEEKETALKLALQENGVKNKKTYVRNLSKSVTEEMQDELQQA